MGLVKKILLGILFSYLFIVWIFVSYKWWILFLIVLIWGIRILIKKIKKDKGTIQ